MTIMFSVFSDDHERAKYASAAWIKSLGHLSPRELADAIADNPAIGEALLGALRAARGISEPIR